MATGTWLPEASGRMPLIGQPVGMLVVPLVGWPRAFGAGAGQKHRRRCSPGSRRAPYLGGRTIRKVDVLSGASCMSVAMMRRP